MFLSFACPASRIQMAMLPLLSVQLVQEKPEIRVDISHSKFNTDFGGLPIPHTLSLHLGLVANLGVPQSYIFDWVYNTAVS